VTTLADLVRGRTTLSGEPLAHIRRLLNTWRPFADLSFSDLVLLAPLAGEDGHRFVVLGHIRPTTGQTVYPTDMMGTIIDEVERPLLTRAWRTGEIVDADANALGTKERIRVQVIPVRCGNHLVGLITRESWPVAQRRPGELERTYLSVFDRFAVMVAQGSFPFAKEEEELENAPRVGDGAIVVDGDTVVQFASPNAISVLHRMGIHAFPAGIALAEIGFVDTAIRQSLRARLPVVEEIERGDVSVLVRSIPLLDHDQPTGAIVLLRDVTDLRRRDRMLMSKDATIREIHHRVKNNLQTIASLLRLQRRRLGSDEAREALAESERRIRSIAIVHETLSRDAADVVHFAEIVRPLVRVVEESVSSPDLSLKFSVSGDAGMLPGEVATPLAVVLNELMQNAVDHAFLGRSAGEVNVMLDRVGDRVILDVIDDGIGLPGGFSLDDATGLGLSIVKALVTGELGGTMEMRNEGGGTRVHLAVPVEMPRVEV
jgi:two-component sensor histidine kinase